MLTVLPLSSQPLMIVIDSVKDDAIALGYNIEVSPLFVLSAGLVVAPLGTMLLPFQATLFFRIWISHTFFWSALSIFSTIPTIYSFSTTSQMN